LWEQTSRKSPYMTDSKKKGGHFWAQDYTKRRGGDERAEIRQQKKSISAITGRVRRREYKRKLLLNSTPREKKICPKAKRGGIFFGNHEKTRGGGGEKKFPVRSRGLEKSFKRSVKGKF